jgi:antitoxin CptB
MNDHPEDMSMSQLQWACRRGMLELDVLLSNFLREAYSKAAYEDQQSFIELLNCADPELFTWLMGYEAPPHEFMKIVGMIRQHARSRI